jgi:hypothetical protein
VRFFFFSTCLVSFASLLFPLSVLSFQLSSFRSSFRILVMEEVTIVPPKALDMTSPWTHMAIRHVFHTNKDLFLSRLLPLVYARTTDRGGSSHGQVAFGFIFSSLTSS